MVNQETLPVAPAEAMQFGRTLQRLLQRILLADPVHGPVYIAKIDIADGFYRVALNPRDTPKLAVLLPQIGNEEPMVAIPHVLPMGWVASPPYFSAVTETAADVMNHRLPQAKEEPPHRLELVALPPTVVSTAPTEIAAANATRIPSAAPIATATPVPTLQPTTAIHTPGYRRPIRYANVYVDDFLALIQGNKHQRLQTMRTILHVLDLVLRPLDPSDGNFRQEPASVKKLKKGDANWSTKKVVLGWAVDTVAKTIELPPHHVEQLHLILDSIQPNQKRTTAKVWHKLLGELRSMALAIPGARGLSCQRKSKCNS